MSARIAILTPAPGAPETDSRWPAVFERTAAPMCAAGVEVEHRGWTWADDLAALDLVLPLLAWGYPRDPARWQAAVDAWEAAGVRIANPPPVLRWNADKSYLDRLAARGAPVVPVRYVDRLTLAEMHAAAAAFGSDALVASPGCRQA